VELNLINDLLFKNVEVGGAEISSSILLRLAGAAGFAEWYERVTRGSHS
jgi:hypothetical protein